MRTLLVAVAFLAVGLAGCGQAGSSPSAAPGPSGVVYMPPLPLTDVELLTRIEERLYRLCVVDYAQDAQLDRRDLAAMGIDTTSNACGSPP